MANTGRKPINPIPHSGFLLVPVKIPLVMFDSIPDGPKNAVGLSNTRMTTIRPFVPKDLEKNKNVLDSKPVRQIKDWLRNTKGRRGIERRQLSVNVSVICPKCKEIGNPIVEYAPQYIKVRDNPDPKPTRELILFYNHPKGSKHERCKICRLVNGYMFAPLPNSKVDLRDLMLSPVVRHISNKDPGYEKYFKTFDIRS